MVVPNKMLTVIVIVVVIEVVRVEVIIRMMITELIIPQFPLGLFFTLYLERLNLMLFLGRRRRR